MGPVLTPEIRAELRSKYAHRYPEVSKEIVLGGERLTLVIGNPSGACELPDGEVPDPAWGDMLAALYTQEQDPSLGARMAQDLILWPPAAHVSAILDRWSQLPQQLLETLQKKIGMHSGAVEETDAATTSRLASVLNKSRYGFCRQLIVPDGFDAEGARKYSTFPIVIATPSSKQWRAWQTRMKEDGADHWEVCQKLARDMVTGIEGAPDLAAVIKRWPGVVVAIIRELTVAVGATIEVELGEL